MTPLSSTVGPAPTAPVADNPAPAPVLSPNDVAAVIAGSSDPAALLIHVVLAVAARSGSAAEQGALLSAVQARCAQTLRDVRQTLLAAVGEEPGAYEGFAVIRRSGARAVDYDRLFAEHPDVYGEVVRTGPPTLIVRYSD